MTAHHPTGKTLMQGDDGSLFIISRETDRDGTTAYLLDRVTHLELIDAFKHKYEAAHAISDLTRTP